MKNYSKISPKLGVPSFDNVLLAIEKPQEKSSGGIILTDETKDLEKYATSFGRIVALGPLAFQYTVGGQRRGHEHRNGSEIKPGDYVVFRTYAGQMLEHVADNEEFRVIKAAECMQYFTKESVEDNG